MQRTSGTWDFGQCLKWDQLGHPWISQDVKEHLEPGTLSSVPVRTSWDIPGCEGTSGTWDFGRCPRLDRLGYSRMGTLRPGMVSTEGPR